MAQLTFTAGAVTSTVTASNARAATVFKNAAQHLGYTGDITDNQAVADYVMGQLKTTLTGWSRQWQERVDVESARNSVRSDQSLEFKD